LTVLTISAALALANACVGPTLAPVMVGIAQHESGLDPAAINHNRNGSTDYGIAQVNSANFGWLGLNAQTAMDPCQNLRAGARVLLAKYNGNPPDADKITYAAAVMAAIPTRTRPADPPAAIDDRPADPTDETNFIAGDLK